MFGRDRARRDVMGQGWLRLVGAAVLLPAMLVQQAWAWGSDGHRMINRLASANLPGDVPAFLRDGSAQDAMAYYGPEPDRWRGPLEPELSAAGAPEHFLDMEYFDLLPVVPKRRYDYVRALAVLQKEHPELPLSVEKVGLQPYATSEVWERLKAAMREYRETVAANAAVGTAAVPGAVGQSGRETVGGSGVSAPAVKVDTAPVERAIVFYAGWLGHYVGDASNPMHTSLNYNGWTGPNPHGYTTEHTIHAKFESVYVSANVRLGDVAPLVAAAQPKVIGDEWAQYLEYMQHTHSLLERSYALDKEGAFDGAGTPAGKAFVDERLAAGAIELRDLIYTAWVRSADPVPERHGG